MQITQIHAHAKRTVSDGRHGNETYAVDLNADLHEGDDADAAIAELTRRAAGYVSEALKRSTSPDVQRGAETEDERQARRQRERAEHQAQRERRNAERQAERDLVVEALRGLVDQPDAERQAERDLAAAEAHAAALMEPDDDGDGDGDGRAPF